MSLIDGLDYHLTVIEGEKSQWSDLSGLNLLTLFLRGLIDHQAKYNQSHLLNLSSLYDWLMNEHHKLL